MTFIKRLKISVALFGIILFSILIIVNPTICKNGVINGILICGRVIIPSLFPFTMCVLFIMKSGVAEKFSFLSPLTKRFFGLSGENFSLFLLSLIGGYPVGARLIKEAYQNDRLTKEEARVMLGFCVNAGPAFIIGAVGSGVLGSKKIGVFLFLSHILSSVVLCFISRFFKPLSKTRKRKAVIKISASDNFVLSTADAASSVISICSFVILFSAINAYIEALSAKFPYITNLLFFTEVTNGILYTDNIYTISFLLGLGGFCVLCQVLSCTREIGVNYLPFLSFRLLHGLLSVFFTKLFLKVFSVTLSTFSSGGSFSPRILYSTPALAVSMLLMSIIFMVSVSSKKYTAKILEDII